MIIRDKPGLRELLFALRGSVLPVIAPSLVVVALAAAAVVALDRFVSPMPHVSPVPFTVFGVALSLFLGFRNNAAYDRWWEARRLWGGLVADTRALIREAELFLGPGAETRALLMGQRDFPHGLRRALRGEAAGCERIRSTPLPYVYSLLIFRTSWLYCLLLPLALLEGPGWMAPVFVSIVAYVFFGLAEVTEELAHPFGQTANALPLSAICRTCDIALAPALGEPVPAPLQPVGFRLD